MKITAVDFKNLDNKSKTEIIITSVLIAVFLVIVINTVNTLRSKRGARPPVPISPNLLEEVRKHGLENAAEAVTQKKKDFIKDEFPAWGRDPFREADISLSRLGLQGIMWDPENPKAIISNRIVQVGDSVGENTIIEIKRDKVVLTDGTNTFELRLLLK